MSSFTYLKQLPVDYLKIDGSFVRDLGRSDLADAVIRSITDIAHVLDKRTVAEHVGDGGRVRVEDEEPAATLHRGTEVPQVHHPEHATDVVAAIG